MSEFTEKLRSSELVWNAVNEVDKDQADVGLLIEIIRNEFKDWQPPKPLVKIPQFMADWFEYQLKNNNDLDKFDGNDVFRIIQDVIKVSNDESTWEDYGITDEIAKFAEDNEELFLNLIVNCSFKVGYTVEKEKKYILKHIDLSKFSEDSSLYLSRSIKAEVFGKYDHMRVADGVDVSEIEQCHFTQSEIDKLNIGSYEQIEVEP
ncbi:DUF1642 domain-containing protein [Lactococcus raffinolactis]|uniref:DUF1642 domain-containing protein n=1 Tax=Pseudolactococcus raffinolactis TaxID=1366 RepID=UPI0039AE9810